MWIACYSSCGKPDEPKPVDPVTPVNPDPPTPPEDKDNKAPEITLKVSEINVYGGKAVTIETGKLSIGETEAAIWTDDKSAADKCTVALSFAEAGTKATAEAANDNAPDTKADTKAGTSIKSGDTLDKAGTLTITVTDEAGNNAEKNITLTAQWIIGLENLGNLDLQIDKEVSLMDGITAAEGWTISKVEIETNGTRTEIPAPYNYTPVAAGTIRIIITITDGTKTAEFNSDELTVKPMSFTFDSPSAVDVREYTGWNSYKNNVDIYKGPDLNQAKKWYEIYEKNWHVLTLAILKTLDVLGGSERQVALKNWELVMIWEKPEQWNPETDWLREYESDERIWSTHGTTRVEIIKNNSKRIPWIAQDFPNKIICLEWPNSRKNFYGLASSNPNKKYIWYDASNDLLSKNFNDFKVDTEWTDGYYLKELLNLPNVFSINCILNNEDEDHNSLNQNQPPQDNWRYGTFSFNWNQIVTVWYNNTGVFHSYDKYKPEYSKYYTSWIPVWYDYVIASSRYPYDEFWKILINEYNTTSSFQNAVTTGTIVDYAMEKPSMTISELMERNENSLEDVKEIYHNDNEPLTGTNIKYQDSYKFARDLHYPTFPEHVSSTEITDLSGYFETDMPIWLSGKGIEVQINGEWMPARAESVFSASQRLQSSIAKKYRFNPELFRKQSEATDTTPQAVVRMHMINADGNSIDETETALSFSSD